MYCIRMSFRHLKTFPACPAFLACALLCLGIAPVRAIAQADKAPAATDKDKNAQKPAEDKSALPPLPPEAHVQQTIELDGKTLHYTVTVGALPVRDSDGKVAGEVVVTAYTMEGANRPVTFAFNGGPGAASVYLNFGAIGPKHLNAGNEGDSPSDPINLVDNPGTWLDFTDLVFIDPIGTGFSRSKVSEAESKKLFYSTEPDIQYLIAHRLRLAGKERSSQLPQVSRRRKLWRIPRTPHHPLPPVATRCRDERCRSCLALSEPHH